MTAKIALLTWCWWSTSVKRSLSVFHTLNFAGDDSGCAALRVLSCVSDVAAALVMHFPVVGIALSEINTTRQFLCAQYYVMRRRLVGAFACLYRFELRCCSDLREHFFRAARFEFSRRL